MPRHHIKKYELGDDVTTGYAGLLGRLFRKFPLIEKALIKFATCRSAPDGQRRVGVSDLAGKLLQLCRDAHMSADEYPLRAAESAYQSLRKWRARLIDSMGREFLVSEFGENAGRQYDDGLVAYIPPVDPHRIVVFDEWTSHAFTAMPIPDCGGRTRWVPISRYKFISGVRRGDHTICVSRPVLRKEPDIAEFLATLEQAIRPHERLAFTIPGYEYPSTPSSTSDVAGGEWLLPDIMLLDRSLVHMSNQVRLAIATTLGCIILFGPPRRPKARGDVESWHAFISENVRKIPTTTGTGPTDPARGKPEKEAIRLQFHHDLLAQLIENLRVKYCTTGKKSLKAHTPLEDLQRWIGAPTTIVRHLPLNRRADFSLSELRVPVRISCNRKSGNQPVVRFKYAEYIGPKLAQMRTKNEEECMLVINRSAAHVGRLYQGTCEIDVLHARGEWSLPHRLRDRELYYEFAVSRQTKRRDRAKSPVQQLREFCEAQAKDDKDLALVYADIVKHTADPALSTPSPENEPDTTDNPAEIAADPWENLNPLTDEKLW